MGRRLASLLAIGSVVAAAAGPVFLASPASAASFPAGFTDATVAGGLGDATAIAELPGGLMLVTAKAGELTIVNTANGAKTPVTGVPAVCTGSEQGLLGVAVDPDFATNNHIFLYYTHNPGAGCAGGSAVNRVSRFDLASNALSGELPVLDNMGTVGENHNGGYIYIGHDGYLYASVGDGGGSTDGTRAQDPASPNGKIHRIDRNTGAGVTGNIQGTVYAMGLRNPFRLAFKADDAKTRFRIMDVGDGTWEEIDEGGALNYGWPVREGPCTRGSTSNCDPPAPATGFTNPVSWYRTHVSGTCSLVGGAFVPDGAWAGYDGAFLFGDFCSKKIYVQRAGQSGATFSDLSTDAAPMDLRFVKEGNVWSLFYTTFSNGGELHKVTGPAALPTLPPVTDLKFNPVSPTRILDTRSNVGSTAGKLTPNTTIAIQVTGSVVPAAAKAVVLNLTATLADGPGYVTAWPAGQAQPGTSSLNLSQAQETAANAVVVPIGEGGQVNLYSFGGTHLLADVTGYFTSVGSTTDGRFVATSSPTRLLDTRDGTGGKTGPFAAGSSYDLQVSGEGGIPDSGVDAVAVTVTYTQPTAAGYVTVWPTAEPQPLVSTTNPNGPGDIRSNLAIVKLGAGGKLSIFSFQPTHVVIDVVGYFQDGSGDDGLFTVHTPVRFADSRLPGAPFPRIGGGTEATINFTAAVAPDAASALYNLTATNTVAGGYLTAHPDGTAVPVASSVNWSGAGQNRAALTVSSLAAGKKVGLFALTDTDAVVDLAGWFTS